MVIDKVYYYTLDSIYRRQQPDRAGPIHEFRKGSLFSGQLPPPQKLVPGRFGPGSGDTEVGVQGQREELGSSSSSISHHLSMTWQIAALNALSWRVQFAKNSIYTPGSMAAQHCHCHQFCFPAKMVHHHDMILFAQLVTSSESCCLHYISTCFIQKTRISKWGNFSFMVKSRKQIYEFVFIGSLFLHSKSQCWANAGR